MLKFTPKKILEMKEQISATFPLPEDYAFKDNAVPAQVLEILRLSGANGFKTISDTEINWIYHISLLCNENEFNILKSVFANRATLYSFKIGWIFFQLHPNEQRVKDIFSIACNWMSRNKPLDYSKTLPGLTGLPIDDIYIRSLDIIRAEKLVYKDFTDRHAVIFDSTFSQQLLLVYLSRCDKSELSKFESTLVKLIGISSLQFLRPTLQNLTFKFKFDELSTFVVDAIIKRLNAESSEENIGISPQMLLRMRKIRFGHILNEFYTDGSPKYNVFKMLSCFITAIDLFSEKYICINFGTYIVVDSKEWQDYCYAYQPSLYKDLLKKYEDDDFPEDFWPAIDKSEIPTAHDVILDISHSGVVLLEFSSFNMLFSRDLLLSGRLLINDEKMN